MTHKRLIGSSWTGFRARGRLSLIAGACLLPLVLAACGGSDSPGSADTAAPAASQEAEIPAPAAGDPARVLEAEPEAEITGDSIKLGLISVLEGSPFASNGQRGVEGAKFAVEQINANGGVGGVPIELLIEDTRGDIAATTNIVRELATRDNVLALIGPILSGECEAACPVANALGVPVLSPGVGKGGVVQAAGPFVFHLVAEDCQHTSDSLKSVIEEMGFDKISIIKDQKDPVSKFNGDKCFPALLDSIGMQPASVETFTSGDASFAAQVTNLKSTDPDAVILAAGPADAARIAVEMERQGFAPQLLGSGGLQSAGGDFLAAGGTAIDGAILAAQFNPAPDGPAAELIKQFEQETGIEETTLNAAYSYDAVYMIVDAIQKLGVTNDSSDLKTDREKIKTGLATLVDDWVGMGGPTTLEEDGEVQRIPQIATVTGGEMVITAVE